MFLKPITKDEKVEVLATFMGSFILGASFAKDFFMHGRFEIRVFFFGISCLLLLFSISYMIKVRIKLFDKSHPFWSISWLSLFLIGTITAINLFRHQFLMGQVLNLRIQTVVFLVSYTIATDMLYMINRKNLFETLRYKTVYKYLLAPINGISFGTIITGILMWFFKTS